MKFLKLEKVADGKYLKKYELTYENKAGKEKKYEIASRKELNSLEDLGREPSGVSIVATKGDKLVLLREFRMAINKSIYNLIAGMMEKDEDIETCICRELYEETGLTVTKITKILKPSYSAVGITDTKTYVAFVEVDGEFTDHTSDNEEISAKFYTTEEVEELLETEDFSSRAQVVSHFFVELQKQKQSLKSS
ncbi:MAG: NUDIX hydrolase [Lachnospiraceae bacterium]|nr:NUDIX hydrolase [Lachnospiraceae bacterium]